MKRNYTTQKPDQNWKSCDFLELPAGGISNKGQVRSPTQNAVNQTINEAENAEHENTIMPPNHELVPQPGPTRTENPLEQQRQYQQDVQRHRLHRVEPHVVVEAWVSDDAQVEGKEGHEARVRHRPIEAQQGDQGFEEEAQFGELDKQVTSILEGVEEREGVSDSGDQSIRGGGRCAAGDGGGFGFGFSADKLREGD